MSLVMMGALLGCAPPAGGPVEVAPGDDYEAARAALEHRIAATAALDTDDWTRLARLAGSHLAMARLTGAYEPYDRSLDALDAAYALAPAGSGPHETRAAVHYSLHRLAESEAALDAAWDAALLLDDVTEARLRLLGGQLAWHRGDLSGALEGVEASLAIRETYDALAARAHHAWHVGDYARADADYVAAAELLPHDDGQAASWVQLQRGILDLDRGRYDEALVHYLDADGRFPGWWLVHEHIAEVLALTGREDQAERIYRDVIAVTGAPEFGDALADLLGPRSEEGRALREAATATWNDVLRRHPEAAAGHAIDHFLGRGDLARARTLAEANVEARPGPAALAVLAEVHAAAERWNDAAEAAEAALATGFQTPDLLDLAARIERARGDRGEARALADRADRLREG